MWWVDRSLTIDTVRQDRKLVYVHIQNVPEVFKVLLDTGADFSVINKNIATKNHLHMYQPTGFKYIQVADGHRIKRIGYVDIVINVLFPGSDKKKNTNQMKYDTFEEEMTSLKDVICIHSYHYSEIVLVSYQYQIRNHMTYPSPQIFSSSGYILDVYINKFTALPDSIYC